MLDSCFSLWCYLVYCMQYGKHESDHLLTCGFSPGYLVSSNPAESAADDLVRDVPVLSGSFVSCAWLPAAYKMTTAP